MSFAHVDLESWRPPCPLALTLFLSPPLWGPLNTERRNLGPSVPLSLILYTMSGHESLCFFPSTAGQSFSDHG